jgi:uncharacterized protein (DUF1501 family)
MALTRRRFLQGATATVVVTGGLPKVVWGAPTQAQAWNGRSLVVVQLAGGNDGLNTVVPYRQELYKRLRPTVALGDADLLKLDADTALHTGLAKLRAQFDQGNLAVVRAVGYPKPNRSHFESTAIWQTGRLDPHREATGWLGRALDAEAVPAKSPLQALGIGGGGLTPSLYARSPVPSLGSLDAFAVQPDRRYPGDAAAIKQALSSLYAAEPKPAGPLGFIRHVGRTALDSSEALRTAVTSYKSMVDYPRGGLGDQLKLVAQLLAADLGIQIFHVTLGGFDTHANQKGQHANLLTQLSDGIHALLDDAGSHGLQDRLAVMTYSEFGRRVGENGSSGTDHGAASVLFLAGAKVAGGLYGPVPDLSKLDGGDVPFVLDFRSVYASVLQDWLGLGADKLLGPAPAPLALFRRA